MHIPYSLRNVIYHHGTVCISVVHGCQRLVAFLSCCVPNLELDCRLIIQGKGLCEESSANRGLSVIVELILPAKVSIAITRPVFALYRTFTKRRTSELFPTADSPSRPSVYLPLEFRHEIATDPEAQA
jgi:hypothetical protein